MTKFTLAQIDEIASRGTAAEFDNFLNDNDIDVEYLEVNVTNPNFGIYEVYLPDYDATVVFIAGKHFQDEDR